MIRAWSHGLGVLLMAMLLAGAAGAQDSGSNLPELGQQDGPTIIRAPDSFDQDLPPALDLASDPVEILAIGDSLAGGLGAGMTRLSEATGAVEITNRFNESSGLARPEVYDWAESIGKITADRSFDAAVILVGANDRRDIKLGEFRYAFNSPDWIAAYKLQIDRVLDTLKAKGMQVYWISIPPMADPAYAADMTLLNDLIKERVQAKGENFVDIRPAFLAADGSYTDRGLDDTGTERKLRSSDGVGFFKAGNNRLAQLVLAAIEERRKSGQTPVAPAEAVPAAVELPKTPVLGMSLGGGKTQVFDSEDIVEALAASKKEAEQKALEAQEKAKEPKPAVQARIIDAAAASGSASEALITTGAAAPAPAGRFDDFSVTGN